VQAHNQTKFFIAIDSITSFIYNIKRLIVKCLTKAVTDV